MLATYKPIQDSIKELQHKMASFLEDTHFDQLNIKNFDNLFEAFVRFLDIKKSKKDLGKVVICIDEFPVLIQHDKSIPSIIQKVWDLYINSRDDIMLILTGSSINMMKTEVLGYKSPLYGRRTGQWLVDEFKIYILKQYFKNYSNEDIIRTYGVIGGVPGYITRLDPNTPLLENIKNNILTKGSYLYDEPEILMRVELRDPTNYFAILRAIASGSNTFGKIVNTTSLDKSIVSKYLAVLQKLRHIDRELPVLSSVKAKIRAKKGIYWIKDNFFNFWFLYIYPFKSELEYGNIDFVLKHLEETFNTYMGHIFEKLTLTPYIAKRIIPFAYTDIGRWWQKDKEIDLVALDKNSEKIFFGEVKWSTLTSRDIIRILGKLKDKAKLVDWKKDNRETFFGIFAIDIKNREKINLENLHNVNLYSLKDIFNSLNNN